jgi:O-Antigen ligase
VGAVIGALLAAALPRLGVAAFAVPAVAVAAAIVVLRPDLALVFLFVSVVLVEGDTPELIPHGQAYYHTVLKGLSVPDLLAFGAFLGMMLAAARRREAPAGAGPLGPALILLALALVGGAVTAHAAGVKSQLIVENAARILHLVVLPFTVAELVRRRPPLLRGLLVILVALLALKSIVGIGHALGNGSVAEGQALTYLQPTMNWLALTFVLFAIAARFERSRLPWWVLAVAPLATAELLLSYRRSFWIAAVIGLAVVLVLGSRRARMFVALGLAAIGVALYVAISGAGNTTTSSSPIVQRAISLSPTRLAANAEDRYRLDERRNVLAEIRRHPVVGLGIGDPWRARYPLSLEHEGGREYTHIVVLWYWLNLGLVGVLAYVALSLTVLYTAWKVWRGALDPLHRAIGLALLGSFIGLMFAETTGSFTGVDPRFSFIEPIVFGVLGALWNQMRPRSAPTASRRPPQPT